jgi:hypothetical protein
MPFQENVIQAINRLEGLYLKNPKTVYEAIVIDFCNNISIPLSSTLAKYNSLTTKLKHSHTVVVGSKINKHAEKIKVRCDEWIQKHKTGAPKHFVIAARIISITCKTVSLVHQTAEQTFQNTPTTLKHAIMQSIESSTSKTPLPSIEGGIAHNLTACAQNIKTCTEVAQEFHRNDLKFILKLTKTFFELNDIWQAILLLFHPHILHSEPPPISIHATLNHTQ